MTPAQLGLVILSASEVPNFLAGMMPSLFTIRTFAGEKDPEKIAALRRGEVVGTAMALGVGLGASLVADSPAPFLACVATASVLLYEYERAIRTPVAKHVNMSTGQAAA